MNEPQAAAKGPTPLRPVNVFTPPKAVHDMKSLEKVTRDVLGRLGCGNCHSGFDIRFIQFDPAVKQVQAFKVGKNLEVSEALDSQQLGG
jgi:hypothetical protein